MNIGLTSILRERRRQIEVEGWDAKHDDTRHVDGELGKAASCYHWAGDLERIIVGDNCPEEIIPAPQHWPWGKEWWKPASCPRRNYEKAGALYLAEKERLERISGQTIGAIIQCAEMVEVCAAAISSTLSPFVRAFNRQQEAAYSNSASKGFHDKDTMSTEEMGNRFMLIVSEVAEAHDAIRHGNPPDSHIPSFLGTEAELADIVIRCFDMAETHGWRLSEAIEAKMQYNASRPHMHGKLC